ncbi:MAG: S41 family peptidase [Pseudomonadota bacterium]
MRTLIIGLMVAASMPWLAASAQDSFDPQADFEEFWTLFDTHYALMEVKGVDWDTVGAIYQAKITPQTTRSELFTVFEEATDLLNDVHVTVRDEAGGRFARSGGRSLGVGDFDTGVFSLDLITKQYSVDGLKTRAGGTMRYGWLEGGVGYIHLRSFRYPTTTAGAMRETIDAFAEAPAVIIDIRQNGGGSDAVARLIAGHFADKERLVMTAADWLPDRGAEGEKVPWIIEPQEDTFTGKTIILTNDRTISAAENFALIMRAFPHVTLIGQTTAGALADTVPMPVGDGWTFGVPINVIRDANGRSWEGIGVPPNLWITNTPSDIIAGKDRVLDLALISVHANP